MDQKTFLMEMEDIFNVCLETCRKKNADYAGAADPFANFRLSEMIDIAPEDGIMVRMTDKLKRVANLAHKGGKGQVVDESIEDTLRDLMVYAAILILWFREHGFARASKELSDMMQSAVERAGPPIPRYAYASKGHNLPAEGREWAADGPIIQNGQPQAGSSNPYLAPKDEQELFEAGQRAVDNRKTST